MSVSIYDLPLDVISYMSTFLEYPLLFFNTCTHFRAIFLKLLSTRIGRERFFGDNRIIVKLSDQATNILYNLTGDKIWCHMCKIYIKKENYQSHVLKRRLHGRIKGVCVCLGDKHDINCNVVVRKCELCKSNILYSNSIVTILRSKNNNRDMKRRNPFFKCMDCGLGVPYNPYDPRGCLTCMQFKCSKLRCLVCGKYYSCHEIHYCTDFETDTRLFFSIVFN